MFANTSALTQNLESKRAVAPLLETTYIALKEYRQDFISMIGKKIEEGRLTVRDAFGIKLGMEESVRKFDGRPPVERNAIEQLPPVTEKRLDKSPNEPTITLTEVVSPGSTPVPQTRPNSRQSDLTHLENRSSLAKFALDRSWS